MAIKKIPKTDLDYVEFYATQLKNNSEIFKQHNKLINSQINSSQTLFRNMFGTGEDFKKNAREYLKARGLI